ncbi:MAG: recombinase RecA [Myxococcota bacterium]
MSRNKESLQLIKQAVLAIEKHFGKGAIMRLGEQAIESSVQVIPSGCLGIDSALGVGGFPRGRIIEVFGPESSGKTTLALHAIAQAHRLGGVCAFIDAEHALDVTYAKALGVDPDNLLISQPDSGEQALEICETLVRSGAVDVVVLDSVAALVPRAEIEGEMGDAHMGAQARLMSQAMRKLTGIAHKTGCALIFINQLRQKIGVVYGNPEVTTGGNALKFYASVRIEVRRVGPLKEGADIVGNRTRIKVVKNKLAPPFKQIEVDILYGRGIWAMGDLVDTALELGILEKSGTWISLGDKQLGQGRARVAKRLEEDLTLQDDLRQAVAAKRRGATTESTQETLTSSKSPMKTSPTAHADDAGKAVDLKKAA